MGQVAPMKRLWLLWCVLLCQWTAQTITQLHSYGQANPELVERQIRALVPEGPRVSMNLAARQVIVVAEPEIQERIAAMVAQLSKPPMELSFRIQHNLDVQNVTVLSGTLFSVPVSSAPPGPLIQRARARLGLEKRGLPVVGSALQVHATLLRESPAIARLRVTPAVIFGILKPYEVVIFEEYAQDVLINAEEYLAMPKALTSHDFYRTFLLSFAEPTAAPKPVGLLLSMEARPAGATAP